jgi:hypothetical protein
VFSQVVYVLGHRLAGETSSVLSPQYEVQMPGRLPGHLSLVPGRHIAFEVIVGEQRDQGGCFGPLAA